MHIYIYAQKLPSANPLHKSKLNILKNWFEDSEKLLEIMYKSLLQKKDCTYDQNLYLKDKNDVTCNPK